MGEHRKRKAGSMTDFHVQDHGIRVYPDNLTEA